MAKTCAAIDRIECTACKFTNPIGTNAKRSTIKLIFGQAMIGCGIEQKPINYDNNNKRILCRFVVIVVVVMNNQIP